MAYFPYSIIILVGMGFRLRQTEFDTESTIIPLLYKLDIVQESYGKILRVQGVRVSREGKRGEVRNRERTTCFSVEKNRCVFCPLSI